jgi:hypothetical protein
LNFFIFYGVIYLARILSSAIKILSAPKQKQGEYKNSPRPEKRKNENTFNRGEQLRKNPYLPIPTPCKYG